MNHSRSNNFVKPIVLTSVQHSGGETDEEGSYYWAHRSRIRFCFGPAIRGGHFGRDRLWAGISLRLLFKRLLSLRLLSVSTAVLQNGRLSRAEMALASWAPLLPAALLSPVLRRSELLFELVGENPASSLCWCVDSRPTLILGLGRN